MPRDGPTFGRARRDGLAWEGLKCGDAMWGAAREPEKCGVAATCGAGAEKCGVAMRGAAAGAEKCGAGADMRGAPPPIPPPMWGAPPPPPPPI